MTNAFRVRATQDTSSTHFEHGSAGALQARAMKDGEDREFLGRFADKNQLFALVDPFFDVPPVMVRAPLETRDTDPTFYEAIAWDQVTYRPPYLVQVNRDGLAWILNSLSTERWGIFLISEMPLLDLARHYQKFVIAKGPDANPYFLRFHDASVLTVLLATWEAREQAVFFGPTLAFGLPDLDTMKVQFVENPFVLHSHALPNPEDCLLQLAETQLRLCGEAIDRDLIKVIYWHLRNHHAKSVQFVQKPLLEARIETCIDKGRRYELGSVADLAGFTALMFELAPNFDDHPSFRNVLGDPSIPPESKMRRLSQVITDREWNEALRSYDRTFWTSALKKTP